MRVPVLTLRSKHSKEVFDKQIVSYIDTLAVCTKYSFTGSATLTSLFYCLVYKSFYCTNKKFSVDRKYRISDICSNIQGMFKDEMIKFLYTMLDYCNTQDMHYLHEILCNGLSYELLYMLYKEPVKVYACIASLYASINHDEELYNLAIEFVVNKSDKPTLDWEKIYLAVVERYD